jgi:hypothetical protein
MCYGGASFESRSGHSFIPHFFLVVLSVLSGGMFQNINRFMQGTLPPKYFMINLLLVIDANGFLK